MTTRRSESEQKNVDQEEIAKFSALASRWWDPDGEFKPLHKINPVRLGFIENHAAGLFGKKILDVGCGGGLLSEAMAERGAEVTGIDLAEPSLKVARLHALESGRNIAYQCIAIETLAQQQPASFDVVTCLEMLEHVPDPVAIVQACAKVVKPGGLIFFSTLNRNVKSWLLGIVAAEHVLGWVPKGTHQHRRFIRPSELLQMCDQAGLEDIAINGLIFHPLNGFILSEKDVDVNYIVALRKPE
ncbi:bifunctional 2-polyprenyl-6-hydroxyphenol methylase/3-demethylubiquinol 3-O-methyltransferase UbiG [Idiomarina aminovorans]|uniref:bifunctional 2-polyprenyl-6-hydroxyphenol methylase/3-demethylubiquinol 3-O-methyltransferase UbiG n=1 Tax=Idiomarina aminovorans TaxID=2914829 RepID=UPI0020044D0D|nr:bifunctional 2-polyprenyl-6-hydroxyphenol methylase/3-demethylubiquinol 3-O-methyltransferase UbiG [Idiomarina sp. ATCH4]MCK7458523.1 bifunctional 2-polyprenyl-6-hydroxyphenol methylase/3-demethylubiquinol 3-O-methyltransferase UbiG [Idiomarina sp. ATCH4]